MIKIANALNVTLDDLARRDIISVMIQKQRTLFIEQTNKLSEMLDVLNKKHSTLEINDEGKFLAILK